MSSQATLVEAIDAIRAGDQATARGLLLDLTAREPQSAEGWLWLAAVTSDPAVKLTHLRQAHALAPNDRRTIAGLRALGDIVGDPLPEPRKPKAPSKLVAQPETVTPETAGAPAHPFAMPRFAATGVRTRRPLPWLLIALVCVAMILAPLAYMFA